MPATITPADRLALAAELARVLTNEVTLTEWEDDKIPLISRALQSVLTQPEGYRQAERVLIRVIRDGN